MTSRRYEIKILYQKHQSLPYEQMYFISLIRRAHNNGIFAKYLLSSFFIYLVNRMRECCNVWRSTFVYISTNVLDS
jgi:hypothetical protein